MEHTTFATWGRRFLITGLCGITAVALTLPANFAYADTAADAQASSDEALNELYSLQQVREQKSQEYTEALEKYQQAVSDRDAASQRLTELEGQISDIQDNLGDRAHDMYRDGSASFLDVLLGSTSFSEFTQNWDLLNKINQKDANDIQDAKILKKEAAEQQATYAQAADDAQAASEQAQQAYEAAISAADQAQARYDTLSAEEQAQVASSNTETLQAAAAEMGATVNSDGSVTDNTTGITYSDVSSYTSATGNDIVARARSMIGSRYVYGADQEGAFDCSGLASYALTGTYNRVGNTVTFMNNYQQVSKAQVGDFVVNEGHIAVISGVDENGNITSIVHAINESQGVQETGMNGYFSDGDYIIVTAG